MMLVMRSGAFTDVAAETELRLLAGKIDLVSKKPQKERERKPRVRRFASRRCRLAVLDEPFDHNDSIFELEYDGIARSRR
jgi:hypothetical protein